MPGPADPKLFEDLQDTSIRDKEAKRMWSAFQHIEAAPITMPASEFKEFEMLFSSETIKPAELYTPEELQNISVLTDRFKTKVNGYKPLHIVDDVTGAVLFVLPAMYQPVEQLRGKGREAVDIARNMADTAYDQPWKVKEAIHNLSHHLAAVHDKNTTIKHGQEFLNQAAKLHDTVLNTTIAGPGKFVHKSAAQKNATGIPVKQAAPIQDDDSLDDLFE